MKKALAILAIVFGLPGFLIVYNPPMMLGGFGLLLGMIGLTISPLVLLAALIYTAVQLWKGQ